MTQAFKACTPAKQLEYPPKITTFTMAGNFSNLVLRSNSTVVDNGCRIDDIVIVKILTIWCPLGCS
jgi:hypothetical protein